MSDEQPPPHTRTRAQRVQENLYRFPYHFIPHWSERTFSQTVSLTWGYEYVSYLQFVIDRLGDFNFESLLDVGCGDGRFLSEVRHRYPKRQLTGIDYSGRAIQWARACSPDVEWINGDITRTGSVPRSYEVVTLIETLEHIELADLSAFVAALRRCIGDNGMLLLTVPSSNVPISAHHVQHFDLRRLSAVLERHFTIDQVVYLNRTSRIVKFAFRYLASNRFYVVTHPGVLSALFRWYCKHFLIGGAKDTKRIFLACRAKPHQRDA